MAATSSQPFGASTSSFRTSQAAYPTSQSYSDSSLTTLPTLAFNFNDLRQRMAEFTTRFDAYIDASRKSVLSSRNDFRARLSELNEESRTTGQKIENIHTTLATHEGTMEREEQEKKEIQSQISSLESTATSERTRRDKLKSELAAVQRQITAKETAQKEYADRMAAQASQNKPELAFWEEYLGCRIQGIGDGTDGLIRVEYSFAPARGAKEEQKANFELEVPDGEGVYKVVQCKPRLESDQVERVVRKLNETRNIAVLLKGMRTLFSNVLNEHNLPVR